MTHPSDTTAPPSETVDVTVVVTLFNEQATVAELARRASPPPTRASAASASSATSASIPRCTPVSRVRAAP